MEKSDITPQTFPRYVPNPMFARMPAYLKDHKNYRKLKKLIYESFAGKHSHREVIEWAACAGCQRRFAERGDLLKKLGFTSTAQYMAWQKIHEQIDSMKRVKLR